VHHSDCDPWKLICDARPQALDIVLNFLDLYLLPDIA